MTLLLWIVRMPIATTKIPFVFLFAICIALTGSYAFSEVPYAAKVLPNSTTALIAFPDFQQFRKSYFNSSISRASESTPNSTDFQTCLNAIEALFNRKTKGLGIFANELLDIPTSEFSIAFIQSAAGGVNWCLFVNAGPELPAIEIMLPVKESSKTHQIGEILVCDRRSDSMGNFASFFQDDWAVVGNNSDVVKDIAVHWNGNRKDGLAQDPNFQLAWKRWSPAKTSHCCIYLSVQEALRSFRSSVSKISGPFSFVGNIDELVSSVFMDFGFRTEGKDFSATINLNSPQKVDLASAEKYDFSSIAFDASDSSMSVVLMTLDYSKLFDWNVFGRQSVQAGLGSNMLVDVAKSTLANRLICTTRSDGEYLIRVLLTNPENAQGQLLPIVENFMVGFGLRCEAEMQKSNKVYSAWSSNSVKRDEPAVQFGIVGTELLISSIPLARSASFSAEDLLSDYIAFKLVCDKITYATDVQLYSQYVDLNRILKLCSQQRPTDFSMKMARALGIVDWTNIFSGLANSVGPAGASLRQTDFGIVFEFFILPTN